MKPLNHDQARRAAEAIRYAKRVERDQQWRSVAELAQTLAARNVRDMRRAGRRKTL